MIELLAAARAIHFASLMAIFGGRAYALLLRRAGLLGSPPKGGRALFLVAATVAIASGFVWFGLVAGQMSGSWRASLDPAVLQLAAFNTRFGQIFLVRFIGLVALWLLCALGARWSGLTLSILVGLLLASLGAISHGAASDSGIVSVGSISDAGHLLSAGFWLGGLLILLGFLRRHWADHDSMLGALRIFSIWGTPAVVVLVLSGLINAISILPMSEMSPHNSYFDLLAVKVGLAAVMIALAALNRWRFAPALRTDGDRAIRHLTVSIGSEIALGLAIVCITGFLGIMAPH